MNKVTRQLVIFSSCSVIFLGVIYYLNRPSDNIEFSRYSETHALKNIESNREEVHGITPKRDLASQREDLIQMTKFDEKIKRVAKSRQRSLLNLKTKMQYGQSARQMSQTAPPSSETIITNEKSYIPLDDVYAIEKLKVQDTSKYKIVDQKLGYYIIEAGERPPEEAIKVLQNQDNGSFAIFTGVLKVKLKEISDIDSLFRAIPYEIQSVHEDINIVFYRFFSYSETMEAFNILDGPSEESSKILRITIELLEFERSTR